MGCHTPRIVEDRLLSKKFVGKHLVKYNHMLNLLSKFVSKLPTRTTGADSVFSSTAYTSEFCFQTATSITKPYAALFELSTSGHLRSRYEASLNTSPCSLGYNMAAETGYNDDDVPPLEDMSGVLQSVAELKLKQNSTLADSKLCKTSYLEAMDNPEEVKVRSVQKLLGDKDKVQQKQPSTTTKDVISKSRTKPVNASNKNQSFGGFKKGFLLANTKQTDSKKSKQLPSAKIEPLEEIKRADSSKAKDPLVFSEVQEALATQMPLLKSKDWISEDLLSKVEKNPKLMKQLEDARFSQALTAFQANPQKAMLVVQNDPEVKEFIQEFCGLLGEHFTNLAEEEAKKKDPMKKSIETLEAASSRQLGPESKDGATQMEHEQFQRIISDPEIKEILSDGRIQHLIYTLKENPAIAQRTLSELGPEYHGKIQRLIDAGLLGVARK